MAARATSSKGLGVHVDTRPRARKAPQHHAHGCTRCGQRYTDSCKTPFINGECYSCVTGKPRALWDSNSLPRSCCKGQGLDPNNANDRFKDPFSKESTSGAQKMTNPVEMERYGLAGDTDWWMCPNCARTTPYDPKELV